MKSTISQPRLHVAAAIFATLTFAACGGGGSGGGSTPGSPPPPPPPPPPPVNAAPTAQATATPTSPQEGQPFVLDASASTDPEGAALSFSWTQIAGPAVTIATPGQARLELAAAEVTEDTQAVFRVSVSDGTNTASTDVAVTFANISQTPLFFDTGAPIARATMDVRPKAIASLTQFGLMVVTEDFAGGPLSLQKTTIDLDNATLSFEPASDETFEAGTTFQSTAHNQSPAYPADSTRLLAIETNSNRIRFLRAPEDLSKLGVEIDLNVEKPCSVDFGITTRFGGTPRARRYVVGQRGAGMTVFEGGSFTDPATPEFTAVERAEINQSLCPATRIFDSFNGDSIVWDLEVDGSVLALNQSTNTIEWYILHRDLTEFQLQASAPVQTGITSSTPILTATAGVTRQSGSFIFATYSDENHEGEHSLVVATMGNGPVHQSTHKWTIGSPSHISTMDIDRDGMLEIVIISSSSPQAIIFRETANRTPQNPLGLTGPTYLEIGLGATSARTVSATPFSQLAVLYPEKQEIRLFRIN